MSSPDESHAVTVSNYDPYYCQYQIPRSSGPALSLYVYVSSGNTAQDNWESFIRQDAAYVFDELPGAAFHSIGQNADEVAIITDKGTFIKVNLADISNSDGQGNTLVNDKRARLATVLRRAIDNQSANTFCVGDRVVPAEGRNG
jgi:hypothetical protein